MSASTFPSTGSAEDDNLKIQSINENQEILEDSTISKGVLTKAHPNVRILGLVQSIGRNNLRAKEQAIQRLAIDIFRINGRGLTYVILMAKGITKHKEQAQNILKRCRIKDVLFTCEFDNAKPRGYYPSCIKAEVIEKLKKRQDVRNVPHGGQHLKRWPFIFQRPVV